MTVATTPWAANFARRWVWLYTRGLGAELCDGRRDEVESDLWEQASKARPGLGLALLARCLGGLTADVSWRMEHAQISSRAALAALAAAQRVATAGRWTAQRGCPASRSLRRCSRWPWVRWCCSAPPAINAR